MPDKSAEKARELLIEWRRMRYLPEEKVEELLTSALTESRNGAIEECAKAVCLGCRRSEVYEDGKHFRNDGLQPKGTNGRWVLCSAKELRALRGNG